MTPFESIRNICKNNGITINQLELALGYSKGSLKRSKVIGADRIQEIARYFGMSMDQVMGEEETDFSLTLRANEIITRYERKEELYRQLSEKSDKLMCLTMEIDRMRREIDGIKAQIKELDDRK